MQFMSVFKKHYTREEARQILPQVNERLGELVQLREVLHHYDEQIGKQLEAGDDLGGDLVNRYIRGLASVKQILQWFREREIQLKDLDRGLVDFPAYLAGKEVFLCWEKGEEDIEFWHDLESGYAGRERL